MKLLIAIVDRRDCRRVREALTEAGTRFTEVGSVGGFLGQGNVTLLIGLEDERVDEALTLIREHCHSREEVVDVARPDARGYSDTVGQAIPVEVGGATVFVLDVERVVSV